MLKLDGGNTSVEEVDAIAANIVSIDGGIAVLGAEGETVEVYSMLGTMVFKTVATDETDYSLKEVLKRFVDESLEFGETDYGYKTINSNHIDY